jgi:hypothetical protein
MGEAMRRQDLAIQLATDGSEIYLAKVRHSDELKTRVEAAVMEGESFEGATKRIGEAMAEENLAEAFGGQVVRVDPDQYGCQP